MTDSVLGLFISILALIIGYFHFGKEFLKQYVAAVIAVISLLSIINIVKFL